MFLCTGCWEAYDREMDYCPKKSCNGGDVVEVDDDLVPIIVQLNEKNYVTEFCCSGHVYNGSWDTHPHTYIKFGRYIRRDFFPNLPAGFKIEDAQDGSVVIAAEYSPSEGLRTHAMVMNGIAKLALWVAKLPPLSDSTLFDEIETQQKAGQPNKKN